MRLRRLLRALLESTLARDSYEQTVLALRATRNLSIRIDVRKSTYQSSAVPKQSTLCDDTEIRAREPLFFLTHLALAHTLNSSALPALQ